MSGLTNTIGGRDALKAQCRTATATAIRKGELLRMHVCEKCTASTNIECHHKDYANPLDVEWLCHRCHMKEHGKTVRIVPNRQKSKGGQHQISLPKNYSDKLKAAAERDGISKSEVVRRALDALEEQQARKVKELSR